MRRAEKGSPKVLGRRLEDWTRETEAAAQRIVEVLVHAGVSSRETDEAGQALLETMGALVDYRRRQKAIEEPANFDGYLDGRECLRRYWLPDEPYIRSAGKTKLEP